ncbi:hypothetical protein HDU86_007032 [Geranomyces michiganensis]|nr:hypothetical protein HDU86_007032 [Geranomyces michiganensis]
MLTKRLILGLQTLTAVAPLSGQTCRLTFVAAGARPVLLRPILAASFKTRSSIAPDNAADTDREFDKIEKAIGKAVNLKRSVDTKKTVHEKRATNLKRALDKVFFGDITKTVDGKEPFDCRQFLVAMDVSEKNQKAARDKKENAVIIRKNVDGSDIVPPTKKKPSARTIRIVSQAATLIRQPNPLTSLPAPNPPSNNPNLLSPEERVQTWKPIEAYNAADMAFVYLLAHASYHDWGHIAKLFGVHRQQHICVSVCMEMVALIEEELTRRHEAEHPPPPMPPPVPADTPARPWDDETDKQLCKMWTDHTPLPRIAATLRRTEIQCARRARDFVSKAKADVRNRGTTTPKLEPWLEIRPAEKFLWKRGADTSEVVELELLILHFLHSSKVLAPLLVPLSKELRKEIGERIGSDC